FFITRKCNARCPFCFYIDNTSNAKTSVNELSLDEIKKISASMGNLLWLAFSGGEPYLRKDLVEISKIFYDQNKPVFMLYPTNGLLPELIKEQTEQILNDCKNSVVTVKLSLDGLHGDHDALRDTAGCFDKTMQTYELLGELLEQYDNFELGINTVFCSDNQDNMDEIIDFVQSLTKIKTHTISMVRGNLADAHFKKVDYEKYRRAIDRLEKNLKNKTSNHYRFRGARLKAAQDIVQRRLIHQTLLDKKRLIPCYAGRLNLVLTETGDVYPCEILSTSFGNVRNHHYNMKEIVHTEKAQPVLESIDKKCCYCTHECYFITNILFNPRLYPELGREYVQIQNG
ncbi:Radical SAM domain protein, partial [hydrothermal vent metagenome]